MDDAWVCMVIYARARCGHRSARGLTIGKCLMPLAWIWLFWISFYIFSFRKRSLYADVFSFRQLRLRLIALGLTKTFVKYAGCRVYCIELALLSVYYALNAVCSAKNDIIRPNVSFCGYTVAVAGATFCGIIASYRSKFTIFGLGIVVTSWF